MKTFFGYIRVSTAKQGQQGVSLQEQKDAITRYAERSGYRISQWFEERETAAKRGRPVFGEMLGSLRKGRSEGVIIHKIDRSARNLKDWADLGEMIDSGVEIHFAGDSLDMHTRGGRLSADIQAVVAADFIRNLREETRKGFYGRLRQGLYPLPAPVGYRDIGKAKPKEPDPVMAPLVRKVFELYVTGRFNLHGITIEGHRIGLRTKRGAKVGMTGFSYILNNPFYIGLIRIKRTGETFPGVHQPLVTKTLFDRVQGILRGKTNTRVQKHDFLYRRMLECGTCARHLIGEKQKGHVYYRCQNRTCRGTSIREEQVDSVIRGELALLQLEEEELTWIRAVLDHLNQDWAERNETDEKVLRLNLAKTSKRLNRVVDAFLEGNLEKDLYEERKRQLIMERLETEETLANMKANPTVGAERVLDFLELSKTALLRHQLGNPDEKREMVKTHFSNLTVTGKNVSTRLSLPYSELAKRPKTRDGLPCRGIPRTFRDFILSLAREIHMPST